MRFRARTAASVAILVCLAGLGFALSACSPESLLRTAETRPLLDRWGVGQGAVPDIHFNAPQGAWTIAWSNTCPKNYPASYDQLQMLGVATIGTYDRSWYQTHASELWSDDLATADPGARSGYTTVFTHSGSTYLEINSMCGWHVEVWPGTTAEETPSPVDMDKVPKTPPPDDNDGD